MPLILLKRSNQDVGCQTLHQTTLFKEKECCRHSVRLPASGPFGAPCNMHKVGAARCAIQVWPSTTLTVSKMEHLKLMTFGFHPT